MKNLWHLRFILGTPVVNNHQDRVLEWSMENYHERLKFTQDVINIFKTVISRSLPKPLKSILEFKTSGTVSFDNDLNQQIICLAIGCEEVESPGSSIGGFLAFSHEFEHAIREIPGAINKIYNANPISPQQVILNNQDSTNITEVVKITPPLCLQLVDKLRSWSSKKIFDITIILSDSSRVTFDITTIAKSNEAQEPELKEIEGTIVGFTDKDKNFSFQKKGAKPSTVTIPSIDNETRNQLITHLRDKNTITLQVYPTIKYIAGEQKTIAYQFNEITTPQGKLDL